MGQLSRCFVRSGIVLAQRSLLSRFYLPMNHIEAITHARTAAEEQDCPWSEIVLADRVKIWPMEPFWRVIPQRGGETAGTTIVLVNDLTGQTKVYKVRPWSDYDMVRMVAFPLLLLAALCFVVTIILRIVGF